MLCVDYLLNYDRLEYIDKHGREVLHIWHAFLFKIESKDELSGRIIKIKFYANKNMEKWPEIEDICKVYLSQEQIDEIKNEENPEFSEYDLIGDFY